jgi:hypothetical protein
MGTLEKKGEKYIFRQDNGEITAWFDNNEEKMMLSHEGSPLYRRVFNLLAVVGLLYLALIFFLI